LSRKRAEKGPDRRLQIRNGNYFYKRRRVPREVTAFDVRGEHIRLFLLLELLNMCRASAELAGSFRLAPRYEC